LKISASFAIPNFRPSAYALISESEFSERYQYLYERLQFENGIFSFEYALQSNLQTVHSTLKPLISIAEYSSLKRATPRWRQAEWLEAN
jgi:hypothetical protein